MVTLSTVVHLALYFFLVFYHFPSLRPAQEVTYYVDVVNLPVAAPQAGSPVSPAVAPSAPARPAEGTQPALPAPPAMKPARGPAAAGQPGQIDSGREFEDRIRSMQRNQEERRQSDALDELRKRMAARDRAGVPGGAGAEAGSDYANYVQSRLKDALAATINYQTRNPEVVVRLTIGRNGKVAGYVVEKSSRDRLFEEAVAQAVSRAEKTFPPPPGNREFVHGFIFRPEGVGKK